ncbi:M24 family metallopeptidase [Bradyrhizobium embrapense]|uniref:M24 family metallopeptidase n=1 Tax=Bradyrhizobium embrapense TaxID=630921 RepID=UPI00067AF67B|nr:Xaa-Pro peptidase family protein [Bradyrhizobium embrapense]
MSISKGPQAFPRSEYIRRISAVKAEMEHRELDALVITHWANITYLSGNITRMLAQHALVVTSRDEEPKLIVRKMCAPGAYHTSFMEKANVIGYTEELVGKHDRDGFDAVIDYLIESGVEKRGVGIEMGNLTSQAVAKFVTRLGGARIVDCTKAVDWVRTYKSDLEIGIMREAAALADAAILRAAEVIRPGVREADAAAQIMVAQVGGGTGPAATGCRPPLLSSSPRTGTPHILWIDDRFREGTHVNMEVSGNRYGYMAALMRTFSLGKPSDRLRRLHEAQLAGLEAGLNALKPGRSCHDVSEDIYRAIGKHGFSKDSRCGYAIGIEGLLTAWVENTASLGRGDATILKPNMTFHLMLGNWLDEEFGYEISETVRLTETGAEALTSAPRILVEI